MGSKLYLEERSYFEWGLNELSRRIKDYKGDDVLYSVVEPFIKEMNDMCCRSKSEKQRFAFAVAADAGEHVLDQMIFRKERSRERK